MARNNALIRFFYRVNPDTLSDNEWCKRIAEMDYCLEYNGTRVKQKDEQ